MGGLFDEVWTSGGCDIVFDDVLAAQTRIMARRSPQRILTIATSQEFRCLVGQVNRLEGFAESSHDALLLATDRFRTRRSLRKARLSSLRAIRVDCEGVMARARKQGLDWIIKPRWHPSFGEARRLLPGETYFSARSSFGSKGPRPDRVVDELIVEQFASGSTVSMAVMAWAGRYWLVGSDAKERVPGPSVIPDPLKIPSRLEIRSLPAQALRAMGLTDGMFRVKIIVSSPDSVEIVDIHALEEEGLFCTGVAKRPFELWMLMLLAQVDLSACQVIEDFLYGLTCLPATCFAELSCH
jgi:hypothetical protein